VEGIKRRLFIPVFEAGVANVYIVLSLSTKGDIYPGAGGIYALSSNSGCFLGNPSVYARRTSARIDLSKESVLFSTQTCSASGLFATGPTWL
jgi:hypothetical protein